MAFRNHYSNNNNNDFLAEASSDVKLPVSTGLFKPSEEESKRGLSYYTVGD